MDTPPPPLNASVTYQAAPSSAALPTFHNDVPVPPRHGVHLAVLGGYGGVASNTTDTSRNGAQQQFGWGGGLRLGYVFSAQIYLGLTYVWHAGNSYTFTSYDSFNDNQNPERASSRLAYRGAEVGYEIYVQRFTIRPYLGGGQMLLHIEPALPAEEGPYKKGAMAWVGVTGFYHVTDALAAGLDVRGTRIFNGWDSSATVLATLAYRFGFGL